MPIDPLTASLIGGAMGVGSNLFQNHQNQQWATQQQDWNEQMQANQQQWDLDMWNRMNKYNSPQEQMARFAEAGLNPHLIYGKGNPGNATPLRSPDIKPYSRPEAKNVLNGVDVFGQYNQFRNIQAQTNATEAQADQTRVATELTKLKGIEQLLKNKKLSHKEPYFEEEAWYEYKKSFYDMLKSDATQKKVDYESQDLHFKNLVNIGSYKEKIRGAILDNDRKELENEVKKFHAQLAKNGINPNDPAAARILVKILEETGAMEWLQKSGNWEKGLGKMYLGF